MQNSRDSKLKPSSFFNLSTTRQTSISILLLSVIPSLTSFISGYYMAGEAAVVPYAALLGLMAVVLTAAGYRIYKKYPDNILEIRKFVAHLTKGYLPIPTHVTLQRTYESNDLLYIEQSFNILIEEMEKRQDLKIRIEHQRTMVESVSILVEKITHPLEIIRKNLIHLDVIAPLDDEHEDIVRCLKELDRIKKCIRKIMDSRELINRKTQSEDSIPASSPARSLNQSSRPEKPVSNLLGTKNARNLVAA